MDYSEAAKKKRYVFDSRLSSSVCNARQPPKHCCPTRNQRSHTLYWNHLLPILSLSLSLSLILRCYERVSPALPFSIHSAPTSCCLYGFAEFVGRRKRNGRSYTLLAVACINKFVARQQTEQYVYSHRTHDDNLTHCRSSSSESENCTLNRMQLWHSDDYA